MATTTNYSWTTPDDTDLVKDGASAIRTLGSAIDTTTKALNPSTTLGDIEYRSATANTNTRLPIGTTGQVLSVSAGVPAWETISTGGMTLISTTSLTGASVTLSSIPSTYQDLRIVIRDFQPATDTENLRMQFNEDSTANRHSVGIIDNNSAEAFNATSVTVGQPTSDTATNNLQIIYIWDYTNTATWKVATNFNLMQDYTTPTNRWFSNRSFAYNQTGAISSLKFFPGSGNFTAGTIYLYGVK